MSSNTLFVDERDDLFRPFHSLMTHAVNIIAESYLSKNNLMYIENKSLSSWLSYSFTGEESFEEVSDATSCNISSLEQYINHLLCIPSMKLFMKAKHKNGNSKYLMSMIMSLECLTKHAKSVYCYVDREIAVCGYRLESIRQGCERCRLNALKECTNIQHLKQCSYFAVWLAPFQLGTKRILESKDQNAEHKSGTVEQIPTNNNDVQSESTSVDSDPAPPPPPHTKDLVKKMYYKAITLADSGSQGRMLSTPIAKPVRQEKKGNHYILCNFISCLDDAPFQQWVTKNEAIVVSQSYEAL